MFGQRRSESIVIQSSMSCVPEGQLMVDSACAKFDSGRKPRQDSNTAATERHFSFVIAPRDRVPYARINPTNKDTLSLWFCVRRIRLTAGATVVFSLLEGIWI